MARPEVTGRKSRQAMPKAQRSIEPMAYSIAEFCEGHGISIDHYFKLQRLGLGPAVMKAGARTLISVEAAAAWRKAREAATEEAKAAAPAE
jgi:hypothetical protein